MIKLVIFSIQQLLRQKAKTFLVWYAGPTTWNLDKFYTLNFN